MSKLDLPSKKVFIKEINQSKENQDDDDSDPRQRWIIRRPGKQIELSVVWIQGHITDVRRDEDQVTIEDSTGSISVGSISKVPQANQLVTGQYVMVIGELVLKGKSASIRAMKVQDLSNSEINEEMWTLEIIDSHLHG